MIIGILSYKNIKYHPNRRLIEASGNLGHRAILLNPKRIFLNINGDLGASMINSNRIRVDTIVPRIGSTIKEYPLTMIRHFELSGIPSINNYSAISIARNKFLTMQTLKQAELPVIESRYVSNIRNLREAYKEMGGGRVILKLSQGRQGKGVFLINSVKETSKLCGNILGTGKGLIIQRFIPPEARRDIRVLIAGNRVLGAMSVRPKKGEFRSNVHLGGRPEPIQPSKELKRLSIKAVKSIGLDIAGVDIIEDSRGNKWIVDVNYSPGFRGLERVTGKDIASEIIKFIINRIG